MEKRNQVKRGKAPPAEGSGAGIVSVSGLPRLLSAVDPGRFGTTAVNLALLEETSAALDLLLEAHEKVVYELSAPAGGEGEGLDLPPLEPEQKKLAGLFAIVVATAHLERKIARLVDPPEVEGRLSTEGLEELAGLAPEVMASKTASLVTNYLQEMVERPGAEPITSDRAAARCLYAFSVLLQRAAHEVSKRGRLGRLRERLGQRTLAVGGETWKGFLPFSLAAAREAPLLRPVVPEDVVGNRDYIAACLRTARDVAGYDLEAKRNPKKINPILFALGRPGCGKTLAAHAAGNYFTAYCAERGIPSTFKVIRRTDWASSYQNASASNLITIFKDMYAFEGVAGVYWADIDTALASRDDKGLRGEEKANLSAAFNIFDGTLIPMDGKWFMMCDANNLAMDEALRSRVSQEPYTVRGPEKPEDYVRILRDILLKDFGAFVEADEGRWREIGEACVAGDLSGRAMENISKQIIARIQDFEYPDEYFLAPFDRKQAIIRERANRVDAAFVREKIEGYVRFEKQEEERQAGKRFEDAVSEAVFGLNVQKEVFKRAGIPEE
jgi:hypothetical protein